MARTASEISTAIRAQLAVLDPDISTEPLTPERKIIDTVSEVVAEAEVDGFVLDYQFNVDTKVGADLDKFVALFGFARQGGRRSSGTITFQVSNAALSDTSIPAGTQIIKQATSISPAVIFATVATVTLYTGTLSVDAPIESTNAGAYNNVPANSINSLGTSGSNGISAVTNALATTGGTDLETDAELRIRFKNTIFRNISGTSDQYLALALSSRFTNKANVVGPQSRFIEYVQTLSSITTGSHTLPTTPINVVSTTGFPTSGTVYVGGQAVTYTGVTGTTLTGASGGTGVIAAGTIVSVPTVSQIPYSKFSYNFDYFLTDGNIAAETFYSKNGVDFSFLNTVPPKFYINNGTHIPSGSVVLLEHAYTSVNSRNDPANNVLNYVDVFVAGQDATTAIEATVFPPSGNALNNTSVSPYYRQNFRRANDGSVPLATNVMQEILWQPVSILPSTITLGGITYVLNTHYWLIKDITVNEGSRRARNGIEWSSTVNGSNSQTPVAFIAAGTPYVLTYTFNKLPLALNELMDDHRQVTADVLVHQSTNRFFKVHLTVMYSPGYSSTSVDTALSTALTNFFANQQFGVVIQFSDLIEIAHEVVGVDNVRITTAADNGSNFGVREVAADGTTTLNTFTTDFALQDADLPVLNSIVTLRKSQNTWG